MSKMKKLFALLLALAMLLTLAACAGDETPTEPSQTTENAKTPTGTTETPNETDPAVQLTVHENTFFTVGYSEADGWTLAEDDIYMYESGGNAYLRILDEDGYTDVLIEVEAYEEDASDFRESLYANGIELKDYVDGACTLENIGGISMAASDHGDGEWYFFGRDEAAGVNYTVCVSAERTISILPGLGKAIRSPAAQQARWLVLIR